MKPKSVMLLTSPIILDGHRQNIECLECSNGVIVSSCLEGIVRVWDAKTTECINVYERESNLSQIWALCTWECFIAVGCTNGNLEIWNISTGVNCFLYEDDSSGVTAIRYIPENRTIVVCRLNGYIEFTELGNRLLPDFSSASNKNGLLANLRKKTQSNPSSWRFIKDSVSNQQFICHFNRAHGKTVSVVEICKDLVITASFDSLLKVFRSQNGVCLFTLRGHTTTVTALQTQPEIGAISGSSNGEMRMWSLISGESDRFSSKHSASIVAIVFTLSCIASLDIAEMLCIWDLNTRRCLYRWSRTHFPGGCLSLTEMSRNTIVCAGRDSLAVVELTRGQVLRVVELEQKYDHVFITRVLKCEENSVVCDYGERLVILTFYEKEDKSS
ncbi:sterol regulatory element-binding protein cleavage-activating protein-like [Xenia sp. Carnegie-2017]|uniref:sterol regulatory element-binding protein cleavage-activating protein-like n=1 Tax=Xenia sp. Carnegie-2017 TaxID=2897299 RepID=UPI001F043098|nr:sterol regulatory element-binding protein cleavage-activating protein-like [Xenia sp. Carnegie-2017]